jgi:hypothetical protein
MRITIVQYCSPIGKSNSVLITIASPEIIFKFTHFNGQIFKKLIR